MALGSVVLLVLAFPNGNQPWCAWIALVPWLVLLRDCSGRRAFWWSWAIGVAFFLVSISWLTHVTLVGWVILCAYLGLYFGVFGWAVRGAAGPSASRPPALLERPPSGRPRNGRPPAHSAFRSHTDCGCYTGREGARPSPTQLRWVPGLGRTGRGARELMSASALLVVPAVWVGLEYARGRLLSGFGWNLLAYSQSAWPPVIQLAEVTGVWGVSFVIALVNTALARILTAGRPRPQKIRDALITGLCLLGMVGYGSWRISELRLEAEATVVAVVQGNIPQQQKWEPAYWAPIMEQYARLTRQAADMSPGLIVWPETSVPGFLLSDEEVTLWVQGLAVSVNTPLLVGAPIPAHPFDPAGSSWQLTNSAALVSAEGVITQVHDKLHLVPFGEFIPFERDVPWLRAVLPPIGTFSPGDRWTIFDPQANGPARPSPGTHRRWVGDRSAGSREANGRPSPGAPRPVVPFGVLICFEDVFPELARRFVQEGARMLVVITNDAWFGPTAAAYQHAQASTFRAVELRVPVARAANTGWSGCIDPAGRWTGSVRDAAGRELFVPGVQRCEMRPGRGKTLYARWGDWMAILCGLITLAYAGVIGTRP